MIYIKIERRRRDMLVLVLSFMLLLNAADVEFADQDDMSHLVVVVGRYIVNFVTISTSAVLIILVLIPLLFK